MTPPKQNCQRGDVVLALFPHSNLQTAKTRPAVVVQSDDLQTGLPQIVVAMVSSKVSRAGHPSRVLVPVRSSAGQQSGLLTDSVVMTDNLATVLDKAIGRVVGSLPMHDVDAALRHTLGL
jgi:mRNA interferase MazF